jgi:hypothetical protein
MDPSPTLVIWTAIAGGTGGFLGAALSAVLTYRSRAIDRKREQLQRDGNVLGPVSTFLGDVNPDRLAFNVSRDSTVQLERMKALRLRAEAAAGDLRLMAASHPSKKARDLADKLAIAVGNVITSAEWFIGDMVNDHDTSYREATKADYTNAEILLRELRDAAAKVK